MSEQETPDNNSSPKSKFPKKPNIPKNPFSFYWIYGIIVVAIIVVQMRGTLSTGLKEKDTTEFIETMLKQHQVVKIVIVPSENIAEITIGKEYLKLPQYDADKLDQHPRPKP